MEKNLSVTNAPTIPFIVDDEFTIPNVVINSGVLFVQEGLVVDVGIDVVHFLLHDVVILLCHDVDVTALYCLSLIHI